MSVDKGKRVIVCGGRDYSNEDSIWHFLTYLHRKAPIALLIHAGSPAPIQLTEWKIKAIKLAITLERRGYVTREDFSHLKLDHRRWYARDYGWLVMKKGRMVAGPGFPKVKQQHPEVWKKIAKDFDKWALKTLA